MWGKIKCETKKQCYLSQPKVCASTAGVVSCFHNSIWGHFVAWFVSWSTMCTYFHVSSPLWLMSTALEFQTRVKCVNQMTGKVSTIMYSVHSESRIIVGPKSGRIWETGYVVQNLPANSRRPDCIRSQKLHASQWRYGWEWSRAGWLPLVCTTHPANYSNQLETP